MWIAKVQFRHDCILGNRCKEFNVSLQSIGFNVYKEGKNWVSSSLHYMTGTDKNIVQFINSLKKNKAVIKVEYAGNKFFLLEKAQSKAIKYFHPKIIFIKPVIISTNGVETWEIGSWKKNIISTFVNSVKKDFPDAKILKIINSPMNEVFFPQLMPSLTEKQEQAISLALKEGYYNNPRDIDLRLLANLSKKSLSTYQQHLRAAEKKLLTHLHNYKQ